MSLKLRLNKFIALNTGISRRSADSCIKEGRVVINGNKASNLATFIEDGDSVTVDGKILSKKEKKLIYIMMNKPKGYVTSRSDEKGRRTVMDLLKTREYNRDIYPVGRLDLMSEGLLLLTNDGDFAYRVTHPKFNVIKSYIAMVKGEINSDTFNKIKNGIYLKDEGLLKPHSVNIIKKSLNKHLLFIELKNGKNREIRKILEFFGLEIVFLRRAAIGELSLGNLLSGEYTMLKKSTAELVFKNKTGNSKSFDKKPLIKAFNSGRLN